MDSVVLASASSSSAVRASPFPAAPKASDLDFQPHGQLEVSTSKRLSSVQAFRRNSFRSLRRLLTSPPRSRASRPAQSGLPDATEISRGKIDRLPCTPAGFTNPSLDDYGLCDHVLARPAGRPRYPVFVHQAVALLHTVFRPHLAMTPLRFANPSPPSGWVKDFTTSKLSFILGTHRKGRHFCRPLETM